MTENYDHLEVLHEVGFRFISLAYIVEKPQLN